MPHRSHEWFTLQSIPKLSDLPNKAFLSVLATYSALYRHNASESFELFDSQSLGGSYQGELSDGLSLEGDSACVTLGMLCQDFWGGLG